MNSARFAAWSDWAVVSAARASEVSECWISAAARIARCSEASSFMCETRLSTRTPWASVASLAPWLVASSSTSRSLMRLLYFCTTWRAGRRVLVAALRSASSRPSSDRAVVASCCVCAGNEPPIDASCCLTTDAAWLVCDCCVRTTK